VQLTFITSSCAHDTFVQPDRGPQAMHGGPVKNDKKLPARPNLEHLRGQAKTLLPSLKQRQPKARLADAQLAVAGQAGFAGWPALARHVEQLRALEGEWHIAALEIDGTAVPRGALAASRILIDGDRFRTESPEATYEGIFTVDAERTPAHIDIEFVEGPEAGNWSYGIYELRGDRLTLCLGLAGASRPAAFATTAGSGHALERLRRASAARPAHVTGGTPQPATANGPVARATREAFDVPLTPLLRRLEGEWVPVELVMDGKPMPAEWLAFGSRTASGNEVKVVFGGQTMVHAKVRIDDSVSPIAVDYLNLTSRNTGAVTFGIMDWDGEEVRFHMAAPGDPRPSAFEALPRGTLSRWRRR
jgi:uncharacterized protein (TIGR03067 family)